MKSIDLDISVMALFEMPGKLAQVVRALRAMQDKYPTPAGGGFRSFQIRQLYGNLFSMDFISGSL